MSWRSSVGLSQSVWLSCWKSIYEKIHEFIIFMFFWLWQFTNLLYCKWIHLKYWNKYILCIWEKTFYNILTMISLWLYNLNCNSMHLISGGKNSQLFLGLGSWRRLRFSKSWVNDCLQYANTCWSKDVLDVDNNASLVTFCFGLVFSLQSVSVHTLAHQQPFTAFVSIFSRSKSVLMGGGLWPDGKKLGAWFWSCLREEKEEIVVFISVKLSVD